MPLCTDKNTLKHNGIFCIVVWMLLHSYWSRDKMIASLLKTFLNTFLQWKSTHFDPNVIFLCPRGWFNNMPSLVQINQHRTGEKTLSRLILAWFSNAYASLILVNTLRPRTIGRHIADDIFNCIFLNENVWIPIKISLKFVPKDQMNNIPALVQIMAWRRPGDKPLSAPMMVNLLTHICVTRPQWAKLNTYDNHSFWGIDVSGVHRTSLLKCKTQISCSLLNLRD